MLIDKPRCNFKNCRYCFDGNCYSADKYENCQLTDLHSEIAKLTVDLDNAKAEVAREIFEEIEKCSEVALMNGHIETPILCIGLGTLAELKKKFTEEKT